MATVTFTGVQISIDARDAVEAYRIFCEALGDANELIDWSTENSEYTVHKGLQMVDTGATPELWSAGE